MFSSLEVVARNLAWCADPTPAWDTDSVRGASKAVDQLSDQFGELANILETFHSVLNQPNIRDNEARGKFVPLLRQPLDGCMKTTLEIERLLQPFVKTTTGARLSTWKSLRWTFREKNAASLQSQLALNKSALELGLSLAQL